MNDDDRELRELFAKLRREDRGDIPAFRAPAAKGGQRWGPGARIAIAAGIGVIAVVLARPDRTPPNMAGHVVDLGTTAWQSPTDFLLITPGSELLRSIPALGSPDDWTPADQRGRVTAPESTRSRRTS